MNIDVTKHTVAVVTTDDIVIFDAQSALDLIATVSYQHDGINRIALYKEAIAGDFFKLSSGMAGEVLQKFINYGAKLAIIGVFSKYTSKPLHDFIWECNRGNDIFFAATLDEAVEKLATAR